MLRKKYNNTDTCFCFHNIFRNEQNRTHKYLQFTKNYKMRKSNKYYVVPNCRVVSSYSSKETYILQSMAVKKFSSNSLSSFFSMPPEVAHSSLKTSSSSPSSCKNFEATIIETRKRSVGEMLLKYLGLDDLNLEKNIFGFIKISSSYKKWIG